MATAKKKTKAAAAVAPPEAGALTVFDASGSDLRTFVPLQVHQFLAGSCAMQATGNDFILVFSQTVPLLTPEGAVSNAAKNIPVAMATMSPQTAKDLYLLVQRTIQSYEADYGTIVTPYSRAVEKQKASESIAVTKSSNGRAKERP